MSGYCRCVIHHPDVQPWAAFSRRMSKTLFHMMPSSIKSIPKRYSVSPFGVLPSTARTLPLRERYSVSVFYTPGRKRNLQCSGTEGQSLCPGLPTLPESPALDHEGIGLLADIVHLPGKLPGGTVHAADNIEKPAKTGSNRIRMVHANLKEGLSF